MLHLKSPRRNHLLLTTMVNSGILLSMLVVFGSFHLSHNVQVCTMLCHNPSLRKLLVSAGIMLISHIV